MDSKPLFSLIGLVSDRKHLLCSTLDSLRSQTERRFEVILVDPLGKGKIEDLAKPYADLPLRVHVSEGATTSEMMNEGLRLAQGKYIQFLAPGDRYLSREGLAYLSDLVQNNKEPHLVYSGFLMCGSEAVLFPLDRQTLQKGVFSRDSWFLKQAVVDLGGFDPSLSYRSAFELLCRLFLRRGMNAVCSRRILTDGEAKTPQPRAMMGYALETYRILYRHFGLWTAIRWVFVQDHLQMLGWLGRHLKQAFWRQEDF